MNDLNSQQQRLASTAFDLRISNLGSFISQLISTHFPQGKRPTLLDVGAGNGLILKFFQSKGYKVSGIELESQLVTNMKKDPQLKDVWIVKGDITTPGAINLGKQKVYDIVIASDVIEHIKDDKAAIKNLWNLVSPGGVLVITVPAHSFLYGKRDKLWGHHRRYDKSNLDSKIKNLKSSQVVFLRQWNIVGFFIYFLFEKILQKPINESIRYNNSLHSRLIRKVLSGILRLEEFVGGVPIGLTLVAGVKKDYTKDTIHT